MPDEKPPAATDEKSPARKQAGRKQASKDAAAGPEQPQDVAEAVAAAPVSADPEGVPVHVAWARVMRDVGKVSKDSRNTDQNFNFRGVDAVMNTVGPVLRKHGVIVLPGRILETRSERYETRSGAHMHGVMLTLEWTILGPAGDTLTMQTVGESADSGDKAATKAHSVAYRTAYLQALCIPTDDTDPDAETHERAERGQRGATTDRRSGQGRVTEPADQPDRHPTPHQQALDAIAEKAGEKKLTLPEVAADFQAWCGKWINDAATPTSDLNRFYALMDTPPADRPKYEPIQQEGQPQ